MKKLLHALVLTAIPVCLTAQVTVSTTEYTTEQLVKTVLLNNSECPSVTNILASTGTNYNSVNGIGYFQKNATDFAFNDGIVLSTGSAVGAGGPFTVGNEGTNEWLGDADIEPLMGNPGMVFSKNATSLQFDFVAAQNQMSLDYIYASNEYGTFQCTYGDAMAFFLTDVTAGGTPVNIAVIPTTVVPVCTATIRSNAYNSDCQSLNVEYFGSYYEDVAATAPVNFKGITKALTAQAAVIPGHTYHLKMVIADRADVIYDSAIFIQAGSLDIGDFSDAAIVIEAEGGTVLCNGDAVVLSVQESDSYTYTWQYNGLMVNETSNTLTATQPGNYTVTVGLAGTNCVTTSSVTVTSGSVIDGLVVDDLTIYETGTDGVAEFDLSIIFGQLLEQYPEDTFYSVNIYETQADAEFAANAIQNWLYTNVTNPQTLYIRLQSESGCFATMSFTINVLEGINPPSAEPEQTFTEGQTLADLEVEGENIQWYDNSGEGPVFPDGLDAPLPLTTPLEDGMTYYASQTINGVESTERIGVTVHFIMDINDNVLSALSYYPNPVSNVLNIENANSIDSITITTMLGQTVLSKNANSSSTQVDISSLSKGVYFVTIASGSASKTIKIIKE